MKEEAWLKPALFSKIEFRRKIARSDLIVVIELVFLANLCAFVFLAMDEGTGYAASARIALCNPYEDSSKWRWVVWCVVFSLASWMYTAAMNKGAAGSGIPEMRSILSGIEIPDYLSVRMLISKIGGLMLADIAGLSVGKEGPFVHISSCLAEVVIVGLKRVTKLIDQHCFRVELQWDDSRIKSAVMAAACAAGVASTFGASIGGVLFSVEVTVMYYKVDYLWQSFMCAALVQLAIHAGRSLTGDVEEVYISLFTTNLPTNKSWGLDRTKEGFICIAIGILCAILGTLFNCCLLVALRKRNAWLQGTPKVKKSDAAANEQPASASVPDKAAVALEIQPEKVLGKNNRQPKNSKNETYWKQRSMRFSTCMNSWKIMERLSAKEFVQVVLVATLMGLSGALIPSYCATRQNDMINMLFHDDCRAEFRRYYDPDNTLNFTETTDVSDIQAIPEVKFLDLFSAMNGTVALGKLNKHGDINILPFLTSNTTMQCKTVEIPEMAEIEPCLPECFHRGMGQIYGHLLLFLVWKFIVTLACITLPIPCGLFTPVFVMGAVLGRLVGEIIDNLTPGTSIRTHGFAIVGAAALTGSVTHTISTCVIVFELTSQLHWGVIVMSAVAFAKFISRQFRQESVYDIVRLARNLPSLADKPKHANRVFETMKRLQEVAAIDENSTMGDLSKVYHNHTQHHEWPVVKKMPPGSAVPKKEDGTVDFSTADEDRSCYLLIGYTTRDVIGEGLGIFPDSNPINTANTIHAIKELKAAWVLKDPDIHNAHVQDISYQLQLKLSLSLSKLQHDPEQESLLSSEVEMTQVEGGSQDSHRSSESGHTASSSRSHTVSIQSEKGQKVGYMQQPFTTHCDSLLVHLQPVFTTREVKWLYVLNKRGYFCGLIGREEMIGKRGKMQPPDTLGVL